jgi:signal transduction histidine kinase
MLENAAPAERAEIEEAIRDGCDRTCEVRVRLDGAAFRLLLHPAGDGRHTDGVVLPVVREPEAAHVLREDQAIVSAYPVCLVHLDVDGVVTYESQRGCRALGYAAVGDAFASSDAQLDRAVDHLLADGTSFAALPVSVPAPDGSAPLMAYGNPMRDASGGIVGAVVMAVAQTDAEPTAQRTDAGRGAFISTVTHEVRNPLGVVNGFATMLSDELDEFAETVGADLPEPIVEFVETIQLNARRALDILADLSDLAKLEAGALTVRHEPVRLTELVERVAQAFVPGEGGGWRVEVDIEMADLVVTGDPHRIEQILNALLANAAKSAEEAAVRVSMREATAEVEVESDGSRPAVFDDAEPQDATARYQRAGRGLAIARGLAEAMGGRLTYTTRPDGDRAFILSLPAVQGD